MWNTTNSETYYSNREVILRCAKTARKEQRFGRKLMRGFGDAMMKNVRMHFIHVGQSFHQRLCTQFYYGIGQPMLS